MRSKHSRLADGLIGAAVDKLRRAVGGQQDQFFTRQARFNQRRIEIRSCGSGGHNHRHRLAAGLRQSQRQVAKTTFVKMSMMNKSAVFRRRQG